MSFIQVGVLHSLHPFIMQCDQIKILALAIAMIMDTLFRFPLHKPLLKLGFYWIGLVASAYEHEHFINLPCGSFSYLFRVCCEVVISFWFFFLACWLYNDHGWMLLFCFLNTLSRVPGNRDPWSATTIWTGPT